MTENPIYISNLNDFIFCPVSIYFHSLYGDTDRMAMQSTDQINGSAVHETVDNNSYSTRKDILQGTSVYCDKYGLVGKIDLFNVTTGKLVERKKQIKTIFDGYIFQLYAQYFALQEMGYSVKKLELYSYTDNKSYEVQLPEENVEMLKKFEETILLLHDFQPESFVQINADKCRRCIYEPACDRSAL